MGLRKLTEFSKIFLKWKYSLFSFTFTHENKKITLQKKCINYVTLIYFPEKWQSLGIWRISSKKREEIWSFQVFKSLSEVYLENGVTSKVTALWSKLFRTNISPSRPCLSKDTVNFAPLPKAANHIDDNGRLAHFGPIPNAIVIHGIGYWEACQTSKCQVVEFKRASTSMCQDDILWLFIFSDKYFWTGNK